MIDDIDLDDFLAAPAPPKSTHFSMRPYQSQTIESIESGWAEHRAQLAVLATGCHAKGTPIMMASGRTKLVEDILPGDHVMGWDSTARSVQELHRGRQEMVRIVPVKGEPFVVNLDHILTLVRTSRSTGETYPSHKGGVIVDVTVREWLGWNKHKKHIFKLFRAPVSLINSSPQFSIQPYFLGVYLGDGSANIVAVTKPDPEIYLECQAQAAHFGMGVSITGDPENPTYLFNTNNIHHNPLRNALKELGLWQKQSGDRFIPVQYLLSSNEDRRQILAGLMDTDGHLEHGFDYISKSKQLADDVTWLARSLGLAAYTGPCEKYCQTGGGGTYYRVSISGDIDMIPTRIPRKQAKPRRQKKNVLRTGFSVELLPEDDFYGFSIEGDGRFLLGDFTVTHNSGKTVVFSEVTRHEVAKGHKVLILAHTDELIEQARDKFQRMSGLKAAKEKAGDYANRWDTVVVGSVQTLCRELRLKSWPVDHFGLVIVDEAHRSLADSYLKILTHFTCRVLGVTATADRGDKRALGEFYTRIAIDYGIVQAVRDGWLVRPVVQTVPLELDLRGVQTKGSTEGRDLDRTEISERIKPFLGQIAVRIRALAPTRKILCFLPSVETASDLSDAMRAVGYTSDYVSGACTDRDEKVKRYKSGELQVLCNMALLTEGFDHDEIDVIVCLRPTKIRALYTQIVGRGTRPLNEIVGALNSAPDAAARRAIIKASRKPTLMLLDFLWLYEKHDLIRPASLVAKTREQAEAMGAMGDGDLLEQEERAERDLLAQLEKEVRKNSRRAAKTIDPLTSVEECCDPSLTNYAPSTAPDAAPPSEPQLRLLRQNGIDVSKVKTKELASVLISRILKRHQDGLCTPRQLHFLSQLGIPNASMYTRDQAKTLITSKIASWSSHQK